jgi:diacylglycerol kinase (ATP)
MKKIGVIINPNAKKFRLNRASIDKYLQFRSKNVFIETPRDLKELKKVITSYKKMKPDYVCIGGGDGTIHLIVSELINAYKPASVPPILILKEGTMDNIAKTINLKGNGPDLLKRLLKVIEKGGAVSTEGRYTIKIDNNYCFLFGTGLITNFLNKAYSGKEKGFYRNIQVALMTIKEAISGINNGEIFRLTEQEIIIDGEKISLDMAHGILAGTVEHVGMGFSPLRDAVQANGTFQVIIIAMSPGKILKNINKLRTGRRIKSPGYVNILSKSLVMKQQGDFEYTMDGDIYTANKKLRIETGPIIKLVKI